jgi:hypothetical protein
VISVEHNPVWHRRITGALADRDAGGCWDVILRPNRLGDDDRQDFRDYVDAIDSFPDQSFDLVIVDGRARELCLPLAFDKVRPGGFLLLDDADRPDYQGVVETISDWPKRTFQGLRPSRGSSPSVTVIWTRPS